MGVAGFVNVSYLRAAVAAELGVDRDRARLDDAAVAALAGQVAGCAQPEVLRTYWYDIELPEGHPRRASREKYLAAVSTTQGLWVRRVRPAHPDAIFNEELAAAVAAAEGDSAKFTSAFNPEVAFGGPATSALLAADLLALATRPALTVAVVVTDDILIVPALDVARRAGVRIVCVAAGDDLPDAIASMADCVVPITGHALTSLARAADTGRHEPQPTSGTDAVRMRPAIEPAREPDPSPAAGRQESAPKRAVPPVPTWLPAFAQHPQAATTSANDTSATAEPTAPGPVTDLADMFSANERPEASIENLFD